MSLGSWATLLLLVWRAIRHFRQLRWEWCRCRGGIFFRGSFRRLEIVNRRRFWVLWGIWVCWYIDHSWDFSFCIGWSPFVRECPLLIFATKPSLFVWINWIIIIYISISYLFSFFIFISNFHTIINSISSKNQKTFIIPNDMAFYVSEIPIQLYHWSFLY